MNELQQRFFEQKQQSLGVALNDIQQQAVIQTEGPLLLLASPGSGKTTTIIMRIGYMLEVLGINPLRIKAVSFSKASAQDMKKRFAAFFPHLPVVQFSTIHSFAYEVVRTKLQHDHVKYAILEENEKGKSLSKRKILRELFEQINKTPITDDQLEELLTYISYVKNKMLPESEWMIADVKVPKKVEILKAYEQFKRFGTEQVLIDFDDMLILANEFLKDEGICKYYERQFDYVLTDESQDTSLVQHAIIEKLVKRHQNLCVVADEDQSIYSWRGAEVDYLLKFHQKYPSATVLKMTQNYRSSANIVSAANTFIKRNKKRYDKEMFTVNEPSEPIRFQKLSNYRKQLQYIQNEITEIPKDETVAILYRHHLSVIPLMDAFERANISFQMKESTMRFFSHWVVNDVLNFMRLAYNTKNVKVFEQIYRKFNAYITPSQMTKLKQVEGKECVFTKLLDQVKLKEYQHDYIRRIRTAYNRVDFNKTSPSDMLETIRDDFGYTKVLKNLSDAFGFQYDHLMSVFNHLVMIAEHTETMTEFASRLKSLEALATNTNKQADATNVTLSTFHSAKGLEFDHVFLIDCIEGVIPNVKEIALDDPKAQDELEEETRLFYVGITRAKTHLHCICYDKRLQDVCVPSRFYRALEQIVYPKQNGTKMKSTVKRKLPVQYRNERTITNESELLIGHKVSHVMFGEGTILDLMNGTIAIEFSVGVKKFVIDTCMTQGYLERI